MELRDLARLPLDKLLEMQVSDFELVHCVSKMLHTKRYRSGRNPEDLATKAKF